MSKPESQAIIEARIEEARVRCPAHILAESVTSRFAEIA
jgi:hypothetical protein